jgi:predicted nucleotidyltransferase
MNELNSLQLEILKMFESQNQTPEDLIALRKILKDYLNKKETSKLTLLEKKVFKLVKEKVLEIDKKAKIILFGSRARGDARKDSDWDFLVLTSKNATFDLITQIRHNIYNVELETGEAISTVIKYQADWNKQSFLQLNKNIAEEGVEL